MSDNPQWHHFNPVFHINVCEFVKLKHERRLHKKSNGAYLEAVVAVLGKALAIPSPPVVPS